MKRKNGHSGGKIIPFKRPPAETPAAQNDRGDPSRNAQAVPAERPSGTEETVTQDFDADRLLTWKKRSTTVRRVLAAIPSWITPNGVTVFRALLVVPIVVLLREQAYWSALVLTVVAMVLDFVDGALAEVRNLHSTAGAFLDPLGDKVLVCGILLALLDRLPSIGRVPVFTVVTAGICLVAASLTALRVLKLAREQSRRRRLEVVETEPPKAAGIAAKPAGKWKLLAETFSLFALIIGLGIGSTAVVWAGGSLLCVSLVLAFKSFLAQAKTA